MHTLCSRYFEEFLPTLAGRRLVDGLEELTTCFEVDIVDWPPRRRGFVIEDGTFVDVAAEAYSPEATFALNSATFAALISGSRSPIDAFLAQDIEILGDVEKGLSLGPVLEMFFTLFPYSP